MDLRTNIKIDKEYVDHAVKMHSKWKLLADILQIILFLRSGLLFKCQVFLDTSEWELILYCIVCSTSYVNIHGMIFFKVFLCTGKS